MIFWGNSISQPKSACGASNDTKAYLTLHVNKHVTSCEQYEITGDQNESTSTTSEKIGVFRKCVKRLTATPEVQITYL